MLPNPALKYLLLLFPGIFSFFAAGAQLLGGSTPYQFLQMPNAPQLSALGGINISNLTGDAGICFNNPALLRPAMDGQAAVSFNAMPAGIKNYFGAYVGHAEKWATTLAAGVHFFDYGNIERTDAAGNREGTFHPSDYVAQVSGARGYLQNWHYGASIKFIHSGYGAYFSSAMAMDVGAAYYDSAELFQVSLLMRNMGFQLRKYDGSRGESLPFDLQAGITKRLKHAPLQFSLTAHHLYRFDLNYSDTAFNNASGYDITGSGNSFSFDKLLSHLVFAAQVFVTDKIELSAGYNHLRRKELSVPGTSNGLSGFSVGAGALLKKLQIRYAHSNYLNGRGYDQLGLNLFFRGD